MDVDGPACEARAQVVGRAPACSGPAPPGRCRARRPAPAAGPRPPAWCPGVTGTWMNGRPAASAIGRRSSWLDTTSGDLAAEAAGPPAEDQVVQAVAELRDHHQEPWLGLVVEGEVHPELVGGGSETARSRRSRSVRCSAGERRAQEEDVSQSLSSNWWCSTMLKPCSSRKLVTAWTMPGRSGQVKVRTPKDRGSRSERGPRRQWARWRSRRRTNGPPGGRVISI